MPAYAKCDVISRQNKKFKLKYRINKTLQRESIKELVLQFYPFTPFNKNFFVTGTLKKLRNPYRTSPVA